MTLYIVLLKGINVAVKSIEACLSVPLLLVGI